MTDAREKLIELLESVPHAQRLCPDFYVDHLIVNGVTVQEWIPVSEPPLMPGDYLCYFEFEPESPNIICENTYKGGHWMEKEKVTHWMPLPEPPDMRGESK